MPRADRTRPARSIDLALQGGGSHGAFTWGVLDRLLEEPWLHFDGVSGTSAGALNAALLATGLARGGGRQPDREGARQALREFWDAVGANGACFGSVGPAKVKHGQGAGAPAWPALSGLPGWPTFPTFPTFPFDLSAWNPWTRWAEALTDVLSPYQFNPLDINPLRDLVHRHVDIAAIRRGRLSVFVNATAVHTGRPRIFHRDDLSHDALLASACLPQLFRAVEIDGQPYWDGGYSGNPALWPLIYETEALDLVLVQINPLLRPGTPDTAYEIHDRVNEITFNAGLVSEMRAIAFVQKLHDEGRIDTGHYKNLRLHRVADEAGMRHLGAASKLDTSPALLAELHTLGRAAATRWLEGDAAWLGRKSTLDVRRVFLGEQASSEGSAGRRRRPTADARSK